jgi:UDP-N-acetylglucosamine 3-dehydrogenase
MKMVTAAVIGVGVMGSHHARIYGEIAAVKLIGLAEIDPLKAKMVSENFGVFAYTDYQKMLEVLHPQVVSVCVPASQHEEVTIACLEAGAHVIVEKPIATTLEAAARMIVCARRLGRQLMVGHIERFNPIIQVLKNEIDGPRLGKLHQIICRRSAPFPSRVQDVGVVLDSAIHDLDVISFLGHQTPVQVFAEIDHHLHGQHEDTLFSILYYENNFKVLLDVNWLAPIRTREIMIYADHGLLHADTINQTLFFHGNEGITTLLPLPRYDPLKFELQSFLRTVEGETSLEISIQESFSALYLALAIFESGREHQMKHISLTTDSLMEKFVL